ncbi:unnamed protein product [Acanthoscelides obtectus]|uniref:Uncharacterized protein n=1 Tax=Acanthoscelides obtectus TaxID=200917 RepID=A0A9P0LQ00_ACAOB|nr:unnamed protein product [Acanthoscelides obtectus]CAK1651480.1 hypothetical protein AOBTE_LOCUS17315 [Acanthoscelides obtectus]
MQKLSKLLTTVDSSPLSTYAVELIKY